MNSQETLLQEQLMLNVHQVLKLETDKKESHNMPLTTGARANYEQSNTGRVLLAILQRVDLTRVSNLCQATRNDSAPTCGNMLAASRRR